MPAKNVRVYVVLDPQNSDAGFGPMEESEVWIVNESDGQMFHTGTADDNGLVEGRVSVNELMDACASLFGDHEYSGTVAVVDSNKLATLQRLLLRLNMEV